ncbi:MAG TPA: hypothetical protein VLZ74_03895 [Methylocella sp.]|nr:hypothetical protein [Methylocella sp.]
MDYLILDRDFLRFDDLQLSLILVLSHDIRKVCKSFKAEDKLKAVEGKA